jgi:hypothetical protein
MRLKVFCLIMVSIIMLSGLNIFAQTLDVGDIAQDFTLIDINGNSHSLYDNAGKVIFINFFAVL